MLKKDTTEECPCCECDPCDCHGIGEQDEFWRVGQSTGDKRTKDTGMVGQRDWRQSKSGQPLEDRQHTKNSVLSEGGSGDIQTTGPPIQPSSETWCFIYWDCH